MSFSQHNYRTHDGLKMHYRLYGSGAHAVVCLPGLTRNCKDFESLARHLASGYSVITPDLRGRGLSERDPRPSNYHPGTYVRDTWGLLDELGLGRVSVIGTSLGGLMAMIMADQQPGRLRGLVLNDVGAELPPEAVARIMQYAGRTPVAQNWESAVEQARNAYGLAYPNMPLSFWQDFASLCYRENPAKQWEPDVDPAIGEALRKSRRTVAVLQRLRRWGLLRRVGGVNIDTWDSFRSVSMPCLLLRGAISDVLTPDIVEKMRAVKPGMQVVTIPGRGHAPTLDEPESRQAIDDFLARV